MIIQVLDEKQFNNVCDNLKVNPNLSREFIYESYKVAMDGAKELLESNVFGKAIPINSVVLLLYIINEYGYYLDTRNLKSEDIKTSDEKVISQIASIALDKYFTNEHLNYSNEHYISKYSPVISTLDVYLNFILGVLKNYPKNNPKETLVLDITFKGFSMAKAISESIVNGFETEAFSLWRTLHETECILALLSKYGEPIINSYLNHLKYAIAYRGGLKTKEETDKTFEEIKSLMKELDLKSKDMKKFIEYGWLSKVPNYNESPTFKFNFRDGVEYLAGLSNYSKTYEMASEIAHSSPLLFYSRQDYYFHLVTLLLYESFFRLEKSFSDFYLKRISEDEIKRYLNLKTVYYNGLINIYKNEQMLFAKFKNKK